MNCRGLIKSFLFYCVEVLKNKVLSSRCFQITVQGVCNVSGLDGRELIEGPSKTKERKSLSRMIHAREEKFKILIDLR